MNDVELQQILFSKRRDAITFLLALTVLCCIFKSNIFSVIVISLLLAIVKII